MARRIDRVAWARLVDDLIGSTTRGKKAPFARMVGVDPRTLSRWLTGDVDVSEESVRAVARALNLSPADLLVRVGYYAAGEVSAPAAAPPGPDEVVELITGSDLPAHIKQRMLERLGKLRAAQREREADEVKWWIDQAREA